MLPIRPILATPAVLAITSRIWQDQANPDEAGPYVVWSRQAVNPELSLGYAPPGDRTSIRVDVFARTEQERDTLLVACRNAVEARGHVLTIQSLGREESGLWRSTFDADLIDPR